VETNTTIEFAWHLVQVDENGTQSVLGNVNSSRTTVVNYFCPQPNGLSEKQIEDVANWLKGWADHPLVLSELQSRWRNAHISSPDVVANQLTQDLRDSERGFELRLLYPGETYFESLLNRKLFEIQNITTDINETLLDNGIMSPAASAYLWNPSSPYGFFSSQGSAAWSTLLQQDFLNEADSLWATVASAIPDFYDVDGSTELFDRTRVTSFQNSTGPMLSVLAYLQSWRVNPLLLDAVQEQWRRGSTCTDLVEAHESMDGTFPAGFVPEGCQGGFELNPRIQTQILREGTNVTQDVGPAKASFIWDPLNAVSFINKDGFLAWTALMRGCETSDVDSGFCAAECARNPDPDICAPNGEHIVDPNAVEKISGHPMEYLVEGLQIYPEQVDFIVNDWMKNLLDNEVLYGYLLGIFSETFDVTDVRDLPIIEFTHAAITKYLTGEPFSSSDNWGTAGKGVGVVDVEGDEE